MLDLRRARHADPVFRVPREDGAGICLVLTMFFPSVCANRLVRSTMDTSRRRSILIVDDNQDLTLSLSILLKLAGYEVATAHNGYDALAVARERRPDIVLLDIGLPGLDGYEVARRFRCDERLKDVFIIAHSAYAPDMLPGRVTPSPTSTTI